MALTVQELDSKRHDRASFDCGVESLNRYLSNLAVQHRAKGIATTFVLVDDTAAATILGYYSLSAASLAFERLDETDRHALPAYPIPAVRIGRLAASRAHRGQRMGELLLQHAVKRILAARKTLGVYAVLVEAKDTAAASFYRKYGFRLCDEHTRQFYLPLGRD